MHVACYMFHIQSGYIATRFKSPDTGAPIILAIANGRDIATIATIATIILDT